MSDNDSTAAPKLVEATEEELIAFLGEMAKATWKDGEGGPYLLSYVQPDLKQVGKTYKAVVRPRNLVQWAGSAEQQVFHLVRHPIQKAKVGIIPFGKSYEFPEVAPPEASAKAADQEQPARRTKPIVVRFLESLARLPPADLERVHLPVDVIVKLLKD